MLRTSIEAEGYHLAALNSERSEMLAEMESRLLPLRRLRRWLTHPLTVALLESYALRRKRAKQA